MISVSIKSTRFKEILKKIGQLPRGIQETIVKDSLNQSGVFMVSSLQAGFTKSRDPQGAKWEKLHFPFRPDDDGVIRPPKRPTTPASKPLVNTGSLRNDITFEMVGNKAVIIGYGTPDLQKIAWNHQFGIASQAKIQYPGQAAKFITIRPFKRRNMGFATGKAGWVRFGRRNDINSILDIFTANLQKYIGGNFG